MQLFNGDCREILKKLDLQKAIIVSDPPFNIGYHYGTYKDNLNEDEYIAMLKEVFEGKKSVVIHYPESLYKMAVAMNKVPERVVSWVYNSNIARQHRDVVFFDVVPDFNKVRQPYKNLKDKRIQKRIAEGKSSAKLYDWWNVNQIKNVSHEKLDFPCQMPLEVMKNIIGILPEDRFVCIATFEHRAFLSATANNKVLEKVFIPKHQAGSYRLPGSLFNFDEM